jgi:hypothetical protein
MDNQIRFDLNAAIENWRNELAAQPNLASDDRRELETHLRDAIAGFQQLGLNDEESFWLARRRVGQPKQLGEEFVKANPNKIWRERVFWMVLAGLFVNLWINLVSCIPLHNLTSGFLGILSAYAYALLNYLPIIGSAIFLAKGQLNKSYHTLAVISYSRWRFAVIAIALIIVTQGSQTWFSFIYAFQPLPEGMRHMISPHMTYLFWVNEFSYFGWPLMLVALATWLMPTQNRKTPKRA